MRTTINIDDQLFLEAKQLAMASHISFASVIEEALRSSLIMKKAKNNNTISLITAGKGGLIHGVDIDNSASLNELME